MGVRMLIDAMEECMRADKAYVDALNSSDGYEISYYLRHEDNSRDLAERRLEDILNSLIDARVERIISASRN